MAKAKSYQPRNDQGNTSIAQKPTCCKKFEKEKDEACKVEDNAKFRKKQERKNHRREHPKDKKKKAKDGYIVRDKTWKDESCKGLMMDYEMKPDELKEKMDSINKELQEVKDDIDDIVGVAIMKKVEETIDDVKEAKENCTDMIKDADLDIKTTIETMKCGYSIGKFVLRKLENAWDTGTTIGEIIVGDTELGELVHDITSKATEMMEVSENGQSILDAKTPEAKRTAKKDIYDAISKKIAANKCLKARQCHIIPYNENNLPKEKGNYSPTDKAFKLGNDKGCCPGQRAHHIIPAYKFRRTVNKVLIYDCPEYAKKHSTAPAICAEGGKDNGTHGLLHTKTDDNTKNMVKGAYADSEGRTVNLGKKLTTKEKEEKEERKGEEQCKGGANSMNCTIEASAQAFSKVFPHCKKECVKQTLEDFYKKICKGQGEIVPRNKLGKEIKVETNIPKTSGRK